MRGGGNMMKQAMQMQANLKKAQEEIAAMEVTGESGGGMVKVTMNGKHEVKRENGRRRFHSAAFLAEERTFPEYDRACAWEKANLDRLLRV